MGKDRHSLTEEYELTKNQYYQNKSDSILAERYAGLCVDLEKFHEAEKIYLTLIENSPDMSKYNYRLGKVYFALEKYDLALEQQSIAIQKWNGFNWAKLEKIKCCLKLNNKPEAEGMLNELEESIIDKTKDTILYKNLLKTKIDLLLDKKAFEEALVVCKKLIELEPTDGYSHYNCGKILLELKEFDKALTFFYEADKLLKQNYTKDKIATCLAFLDRKQEAIDIYKMIPFRRMDDYILQHFGRLYLAVGDYVNAKAQLKLAIMKGGKSIAKSHFYLGLVYEKLQLYKNALNEFIIAQEKKKNEYKSDFVEALERIDYIKKNITIDENELIEPYVVDENGKSKKEHIGVVEKYFDDKGYGFIKEDQKNKYFFHIKNCSYKTPKENDRVMYILIDGKKGKEAIQVELLKK